MKRKNRIISILLVALLAGSLNVFAGGEDNFVSDYKISHNENFEPSKNFQQSWEITYGESKRPVQILLKQTRKGDEYLVRTKYFEVKYVNSDKGFGVQYLKNGELIVPENLNYRVINARQMDAQKVISMTKIDQQKVLKLIADFLPDLVNEQYKNILN